MICVGRALWATRAAGGQAASVVVRDGGDLEGCRADGAPAWTIRTTARRPYNLDAMWFTRREGPAPA